MLICSKSAARSSNTDVADDVGSTPISGQTQMWGRPGGDTWLMRQSSSSVVPLYLLPEVARHSERTRGLLGEELEV
jgi:hypothetical protein